MDISIHTYVYILVYGSAIDLTLAKTVKNSYILMFDPYSIFVYFGYSSNKAPCIIFRRKDIDLSQANANSLRDVGV